MLNILVPTDFSPAAKKAVECAIHIAKRTNANVTLLHIYQIPVLSARGIPQVANIEVIHENLQLAEEQLKSIENEIGGLREITYTTKTLPMYWLIEFPEIIQEQNADLIIMGTNGASGLKELILGSNTAKVIDNSKCPVLAVPKDARCTKIENIAFAYDKEFLENLSTYCFLIQFTKRFNALLEVFHVKISEQNTDSNEQNLNTHNLKQYLKEIRYSYSEIVGEDVEKSINRYLLEKNIDILVLVHRNRNLFEQLFKKSFSLKMAYHTSIPLLIIPEKN